MVQKHNENINKVRKHHISSYEENKQEFVTSVESELKANSGIDPGIGLC